MAGYHHCEHCNTYHDCGQPVIQQRGGCFAAVMALVLMAMLLPPAVWFAGGYWRDFACDYRPHWQTCRQMVIEADQQQKKLEELRKQHGLPK